MTVTATVRTVYFGKYNRRIVVECMGIASDATEETDGIKIDVSTFTIKGRHDEDIIATSAVIDRIDYDVQGFRAVALEWDHSTDDLIALLSSGGNSGVLDFSGQGGRHDPQSAGGTGDVLLTTVGAAANATYNLTIHARLR